MFKKIIKKAKKIPYMHYVASAITGVFLLMAVFVFPSGIVRIWESLQDLFWSVLYYFTELLDLDVSITPTVNNFSSVPWTPIWGLPATWEEFQACWSVYWSLIISGENIEAYFTAVGDVMRVGSQFILLIGAPLVMVLYMVFQRYLSKHNNDYDKDSKAVTFAKRCADKVYNPTKAWIKSFIDFLRENDKYIEYNERTDLKYIEEKNTL